MRLLILSLFLLSSCAGPVSSGYNILPVEKRKHFVSYNAATINEPVDYNSDNFKIQEVTSEQVSEIANHYNYTWLVIWAPWCLDPKVEELAANYINYEKLFAAKGLKLIFVAVGYGPEGIRKMAQKLDYNNLTFVIADIPEGNGATIFRRNLNPNWKYRNANNYVFQKEKGLIYTGKDLEMKLDELQKVIN